MRDSARAAILGRLKEKGRTSVLVAGGGINGAATFLALALEGVDVVLVDKADIASGASAAPSRMIHGGLRYLENAEFRLVAQSTYERNLLLKNARHLVRPLRTVVPVHSHFGGILGTLKKLTGAYGKTGRRGTLVMQAGLTLYDFLGRKARALPKHRLMSRTALRRQMPGITDTAVGAATYFDAWITHPERLNLELVLDALAAGPHAEALTYARLAAIRDGKAVIHDEIDGTSFEIAPDLLVNATGAWIDLVNAPLGLNRRLIGGTKGSHLVIENTALHNALDGSMLWFEAADGRTCIVFPFLGHVLLGSTDIRVDDPDAVSCDDAEIDYMLRVLAEVMPGLPVDRSEIIFQYSGVRPLPHSSAETTAAISRDHSIDIAEPDARRPFPILSLVGGKWTTFRGFAEEATDAVLTRLGRSRTVATDAVAIGGGKGFPADETAHDALITSEARRTGLCEQRIATLLARYGTRGADVADACAADPSDRPLATLPDYTVAEIAWICREEMVAHLTDLVLRRTLIAIRGNARLDVVDELSFIAADVLGWDAPRRVMEVDALRSRLETHHGARFDHEGEASAAARAPEKHAATP